MSGQLDKFRSTSGQGQAASARSNPDGTTFVQTASTTNNGSNEQRTPVAGTDGRLLPDIMCYNCNTQGHYAGQCPQSDRREEGSGFIQIGTNLVQSENEEQSFDFNPINKNWILLDTCSTHNVSCNPDVLSNIKNCTDDESLKILTNSGSLVYKKIGDCNLLPIKMHFNSKSIANVLLLGVVATIPGVRITMDSMVEKAIIVHTPDGKMLKFSECSDGLYFYDTSNRNKSQVNDYSELSSMIFLLNSVPNNIKNYSKRQVERAIVARKVHHLIGWPSTQKYKSYVQNNLLKNSDVTVKDINRAEDIFGKPTPILKGKSVKKNNKQRE